MSVALGVVLGAAVGLALTRLLGRSLRDSVAVVAALGMLLCLLGTPLNRRERLFCVIAYLPKATVQAAIGAVPLAMGLPCGPMVLAAAVLGILVTAPLGAIGIDASYRRLLTQTTE